MLLFDTGKKLEKAVGEEAASIIMHVFEQYDEQTKKELATKGDVREEANAIRADLREETKAIKADVRETELRLQAEIQKIKLESLKWMIGGWLGLAAIMAKGFGWLGF